MWSDKGHKGQASDMCPVKKEKEKKAIHKTNTNKTNTYHNQTISSSSFISKDLKMSIVGAVTTVSGREFKTAITRLLKKFKRALTRQ